jgi:DNA repair exonuclease SbcCD ATPase subunit
MRVRCQYFTPLGGPCSNENYGETHDYNVEINSTVVTIFQVGENGDGTDAVANAWNTFSDRRWKRDIQPLEDAAAKIGQLGGYTYHWKEGKQDQSEQIGLIAQEVQAVYPQAVSRGPEGYLSVDYSKLLAPLIEVTKQQQQRIEAQQRRLQQQEQRIEQLEAYKQRTQDRFQRLEARLERLERHRGGQVRR